MYLDHQRTLEWIRAVEGVASRHPALARGAVELFVLPTFPVLTEAVNALTAVGVAVGAQDLFWEDRGPFTGEVSGAEIADIGCSYVEVGHAERRRIFGETDDIVSAKTAAAFRNGLTPIICIGETDPQEPAAATAECLRQLRAALAEARRASLLAPALVAYEPQWAIGAAEAAGTPYIRTVCTAVRAALGEEDELRGSRVLYGGSAGAGLLSELDGAVDGLFFGRSSHDIASLRAVLDEAEAAWTSTGS